MTFVSLAEFQTRYENTVPTADTARVSALLNDACALAVDITGTTGKTRIPLASRTPAYVVPVMSTARAQASLRRALTRAVSAVGTVFS